MATITPTTEIYFFGPSFTNAFTLDDPVKGELDSTVYVLDGVPIARDTTSDSVSVRITRGRKDYTRPFPAGRCVLTLRNESGLYDPDNTSSVLYPGVVVGRQVTIKSTVTGGSGAITIFDGIVIDLDLTYTIGGTAELTVICADRLSQLALRTIDAGTSVSEQSTGARINAILALSEVNYTDTTVIATGLSTVAAGTCSGNAKAYLDTVVLAEQGYFYVTRAGTLKFDDRFAPLGGVNKATMSDDGSDIGYQRIDRQVMTTSLFNRLQGKREGSTTQTANNTGSQSSFGIRVLDLGTIPLTTDTVVEDLLNYLLVQTANAETRITSIEVALETASVAEAEALLNLELTDIVTVQFTPPGLGSQLSAASFVESINHTFSVGQTHRMTLGLRPVSIGNYLTLDSATFGQLGENVLAF